MTVGASVRGLELSVRCSAGGAVVQTSGQAEVGVELVEDGVFWVCDGLSEDAVMLDGDTVMVVD